MVFFTRRFLPVLGTSIGNLDVGTEITLNENGEPTNYLIVNQGIPEDSSLYDASCDGTWLLRKDIAEKRQWDSANKNSYKASTIHSYLNGTFLNLFDADIREEIKQVKIPYVNGTGNSAVASGSSGLSCKIFLLSNREVGITASDYQHYPNDGAKLSYFESGTGDTANNKRIAKLNGSATIWWLRSPYILNTNMAAYISISGRYTMGYCTDSEGNRPALVLPFNFKLADSQIIS